MSAALLACAEWESAPAAERARLLARPRGGSAEGIDESVRAIAEQVRAGGDRALIELARQHTGAALEAVAVGEDEFESAAALLAPADREALDAILARGAARARELAAPTLDATYRALGLVR